MSLHQFEQRQGADSVETIVNTTFNELNLQTIVQLVKIKSKK